MKFTPSVPQAYAWDHLANNEAAALFMGCGLGKTGVTLHAIAEKMLLGESRGALIVAPLRVCNLTWPAEVAKWSLSSLFGINNLRTPDGKEALRRKEPGLYCINYEMLDKCAAAWADESHLPFDIVVFDELTKAKSHSSTRINAFRPIARKHCKRRWGLSGTPAPNGLQDLFAEIRLLDDGARLGKSFHAFRQCYFKQDDYMGYSWSPRAGSKEKIYERISDIALTLKSSDWLDIPDVIQEDVEVHLPAGEVAKGYKKLERDLLLPLKSGEITAANAAVLTNKLLQYTSGAVYDENHQWHLVHEAKLEAMRKLLGKLRGSPVILLYQFKHELERLRPFAGELGLTAFSDAKSVAEQETLVNRWNSGDIPVLAAHPKSMAHGLNLQEGGSTIVWMSLTWSREDYDQAIARVARRGQTEITSVYRVVTPGTVDDAVAEALRAKDEEQNALLNALRRYAS